MSRLSAVTFYLGQRFSVLPGVLVNVKFKSNENDLGHQSLASDIVELSLCACIVCERHNSGKKYIDICGFVVCVRGCLQDVHGKCVFATTVHGFQEVFFFYFLIFGGVLHQNKFIL